MSLEKIRPFQVDWFYRVSPKTHLHPSTSCCYRVKLSVTSQTFMVRAVRSCRPVWSSLFSVCSIVVLFISVNSQQLWLFYICWPTSQSIFMMLWTFLNMQIGTLYNICQLVREIITTIFCFVKYKLKPFFLHKLQFFWAAYWNPHNLTGSFLMNAKYIVDGNAVKQNKSFVFWSTRVTCIFSRSKVNHDWGENN